MDFSLIVQKIQQIRDQFQEYLAALFVFLLFVGVAWFLRDQQLIPFGDIPFVRPVQLNQQNLQINSAAIEYTKDKNTPADPISFPSPDLIGRNNPYLPLGVDSITQSEENTNQENE